MRTYANIASLSLESDPSVIAIRLRSVLSFRLMGGTNGGGQAFAGLKYSNVTLNLTSSSNLIVWYFQTSCAFVA